MTKLKILTKPESTELLEPARGSSFFCRAFKALLGSKANFKPKLGSGLAKKKKVESELGWGSAQNLCFWLGTL